VTSYAEEVEKQKLWRLRPQYAATRAFDRLIESEFRDAGEQQARQDRRIRESVSFAMRSVPYYRALVQRLGLSDRDVAGARDLVKLPSLRKYDLVTHYADLKAADLAWQDAGAALSRSSGSTGRPVAVLQSPRSLRSVFLLRQRHCRWHDLDPRKTRLDVRAPRDIFRRPDGALNPDGAVIEKPVWRELGAVFETGPEFAFNVSNPMEQQVAWLRELRPDYAMSYSGVFEEWLLAGGGKPPVDGMTALIANGTALPPSLRLRLEESYRIPIHQGYGLNEIGIVAGRCDAGRYHVHIEHCAVEIAHADGTPCAPGETGHVLVTTLRNRAMPLLRYDTGDMALAVSGPCPCGRTLPSFGEIEGRFRRYAGVPEGTRERVRAIRNGIEACSFAELAFLRRYQIYQDLEDRFTLRLHTAAPVPARFRASVLDAWQKLTGVPAAPLTIAEVEEIPSNPSGKLVDFLSDFHSDSALPLPAQAVPAGALASRGAVIVG
jgi:phenylacetate-CoA ligase